MPVCTAWIFVSGIFIQDLKLNKTVGIIKKRKKKKKKKKKKKPAFSFLDTDTDNRESNLGGRESLL